jgi:hypothetical protein
MFLFESACGGGPGRQVHASDEDPELYPCSGPQRSTTCLVGVHVDVNVDSVPGGWGEGVWLRSRLWDMGHGRSL